MFIKKKKLNISRRGEVSLVNEILNDKNILYQIYYT